MSKEILTDASISVGGTTISSYANKVTVNMSYDDVDVTGFSSSGFKETAQGMADGSIQVTLFQDFATLDPILYDLWSNRGTTSIVVKKSSGGAGTANPTYTMTGRVYEYTPIDGGVGDASTIDTTFRNAGTSGIVRGTV